MFSHLQINSIQQVIPDEFEKFSQEKNNSNSFFQSIAAGILYRAINCKINENNLQYYTKWSVYIAEKLKLFVNYTLKQSDYRDEFILFYNILENRKFDLVPNFNIKPNNKRIEKKEYEIKKFEFLGKFQFESNRGDDETMKSSAINYLLSAVGLRIETFSKHSNSNLYFLNYNEQEAKAYLFMFNRIVLLYKKDDSFSMAVPNKPLLKNLFCLSKDEYCFPIHYSYDSNSAVPVLTEKNLKLLETNFIKIKITLNDLETLDEVVKNLKKERKKLGSNYVGETRYSLHQIFEYIVSRKFSQSQIKEKLWESSFYKYFEHIENKPQKVPSFSDLKLVDQKTTPRKKIFDIFQKYNDTLNYECEVIDVKGDGNCFYSSVAYGLLYRFNNNTLDNIQDKEKRRIQLVKALKHFIAQIVDGFDPRKDFLEYIQKFPNNSELPTSENRIGKDYTIKGFEYLGNYNVPKRKDIDKRYVLTDGEFQEAYDMQDFANVLLSVISLRVFVFQERQHSSSFTLGFIQDKNENKAFNSMFNRSIIIGNSNNFHYNFLTFNQENQKLLYDNFNFKDNDRDIIFPVRYTYSADEYMITIPLTKKILNDSLNFFKYYKNELDQQKSLPELIVFIHNKKMEIYNQSLEYIGETLYTLLEAHKYISNRKFVTRLEDIVNDTPNKWCQEYIKFLIKIKNKLMYNKFM